jgi:serine/threonine-protein kinase
MVSMLVRCGDLVSVKSTEPHANRTHVAESMRRITLTAMSSEPIARGVVIEQLDRILSSAPFRATERSRTILRYLVERTLDGQGDRLKEYTIGAEALGRGVGFDPRTDPIVRAEVSRLRTRLDRYYSTEGSNDDVVIELPKGTYVARFSRREDERQPAIPRDTSPAIVHRRPVLWLLAGSFATLAAFAVGAWVAKTAARDVKRSLVVVNVQLQSTGLIGSEVGTDAVISSTGSSVVFVSADSAGVTRLRVRRFDGSPPSDLPGTEGARGPFLSPDGHWVAFWSGGKLKKTSIDGGAPVVICDATDLLGGSWGPDGSIIAALDATGKLWRVSSGGGAPVIVADLQPEQGAPRWPQILPGSNRVLYTAVTALGADRGNIEVMSLADRHRTVLVKGGTYGRYVAPGYLLYVNQGTVYAVRLDADRLEVRGTAVPIVDDVSYSSTFGYAQVDISTNGTLIYRRAPGHGQTIVAMIDSGGHARPVVDKPGRYLWPAVSPDGNRLALSATESGVSAISLYDNLNERTHRVGSIAGYTAAIWTKDGRSLVASKPSSGLAWVPVNGSPARSLIDGKTVAVPWTFTPDGRGLAFYEMSATTAFDLWSVSIAGSDTSVRAGTPEPLLQTPAFEVYPAFSPDGRWLAYASNESGAWEVYVRAVPDNGTKVQVSTHGGRIPRWSRHGHELFFGTDDQRLMMLRYAATARVFVPESPRLWTQVHLADTGVLPNFDVMPDGQHVVALMPAVRPDDAPAENHVTLLFNLGDELRRRLP